MEQKLGKISPRLLAEVGSQRMNWWPWPSAMASNCSWVVLLGHFSPTSDISNNHGVVDSGQIVSVSRCFQRPGLEMRDFESLEVSGFGK